MADSGDDLENLIIDLYNVQALKFGKYTLKSGIESPIYFDLRVIVSHPELMVKVSDFLWRAVQRSGCEFDNVCGVPYTALPLATIICAHHKFPMLIRRKEAKDYGTKKIIEGHYKRGDVCLIVEDVVTTGSSVLETVQCLNSEGILVKDAVVLLDREQGGAQALHNHKIKLHSICGISKLIEVLTKAGKIDEETAAKVKQFVQENSFENPQQGQKRKLNECDGTEQGDVQTKKTKKALSYKERAEVCTHPLSRRLFNIMHEKRTNLCLSADATTASQLIQLAESIGPHICILKTHIDIVQDFTPQTATSLKTLAEKHNFLLFEDRKFADIGNTVKHQYEDGVYHICDWAHIINAHTVSGPGVIAALKQVGQPLGRACLLVAEMSCAGNLISPDYTQATVKMADENADFVMGFITQSKLSTDPNFVHMTPGVKLEEGGDGLSQQYLTPAKVIKDSGSDVIIVGRGILHADDPVTAAILYKEAGYSAHQQTL